MDKNSTIIHVSRRKQVLHLLGCSGFVAVCVWLLVAAPQSNNSVFNNAFVRYGVSGLGIVFFGAIAVLHTRNLIAGKSRVLIDEKGFQDGTSAFSVRFVNWQEVEGLALIEFVNQVFILVRLREPEQFLREQPLVQRWAMQYNHNKFGTPLVMSTNMYQHTAEELFAVMDENLRRFNFRENPLPDDRNTTLH